MVKSNIELITTLLIVLQIPNFQEQVKLEIERAVWLFVNVFFISKQTDWWKYGIENSSNHAVTSILISNQVYLLIFLMLHI